jgi:hypothetical protein
VLRSPCELARIRGFLAFGDLTFAETTSAEALERYFSFVGHEPPSRCGAANIVANPFVRYLYVIPAGHTDVVHSMVLLQDLATNLLEFKWFGASSDSPQRSEIGRHQ